MYQSFTRMTSALLVFVFAMSMLPVSIHAAFIDVSASYDYKAAIEALQNDGVLTGYSDGTFKPESRINRAEFLAILLRTRATEAVTRENCFPDVGNQWFAFFVCTAKEEGIVGGYPDGLFKPEQPINFVEAAKILSLAYKQNPASVGSTDWYEPFALALDSSHAIPPTINTLDSPLSRGEMAEMMWRLSENKTTEESRSFMNVKHPELSIDMSSSVPQFARTCTDLQAFTQKTAQDSSGMYYLNKGLEMAPMATMSQDSGASSRTSNQSPSYSQTNVQVQGVDEGDIVKTDGNYVYVLSQRDQKIRIIDARDQQKLTVIATIADETFMPRDLFIQGDTLVAIGALNTWNTPTPYMEDSAAKMMAPMIYPPFYSVQKTTVKLYDVSVHTAPKVIRTVSFEGNALSTRLVDGKVIAVLNAGTRYYGYNMPDSGGKSVVPVYDDSATGMKDEPIVDCSRVSILPRIPRPQYLVVAQIPLSATATISRSVILGNGDTIYVSEDNVYVAATQWNYFWGKGGHGSSEEQTTLYRFSLESNGVEFSAHGSVPGHLLNQFSMDEYGDTFRVATTIGEQWTGGTSSIPSTNNLFVLNKDLETVGAVKNIAPGESIYAVRFLGKRAYMVTFKQIDPLFVIDLADARSPKILGKLKIPGYSNYLHPVDENHLIGFGKEVDESIDKDKVHSDNAVYYTAVLGVKMGMFDVSDVANPKEIAKEVIGARGSDSPLLSDHKALFFDAERGVLAFPVTVYEGRSTPKVNQYDPDTVATFQGAYVYNFSPANGFSLRGKITHHTPDEFMKSGDYWYDAQGLDISRIFRIGSSIFTLSDAKIQSSSLSVLAPLSSAELSKSDSHSTVPIMPMVR